MPSAPMRCSCPHCGGRLSLKDRGLIGKRIKCPKCDKSFVVESAEEEEIEEKPRKKSSSAASRGDETESDEPPPRKKKRMDDEDEDTETRSSRKKKKRKKKGSPLPWILAGGGVVVVAAAAIVLIVVLNRKGTGGSGPVAGQGATQEKKGDNQGANPVANPDLAVDVGGTWPEPAPLPGVIAPGAAVVVMHIVLTGDSYKISKMEVGKTEKRIRDRLLAIAGPGVGHIGASDDAPDGAARRISMRMGPMKDTARDFAKKIDFGTVREVTDQIITLVVRKEIAANLKAAP